MRKGTNCPTDLSHRDCIACAKQAFAIAAHLVEPQSEGQTE